MWRSLFAALALGLAWMTSITATFTCEEGQTQITSRWIFSNTEECGKLVTQLPDFYNEVYRRGCQRWMGLSEMPEQIENAYVTQCYKYSNGTARYRASLCCAGVVAQRCFSCDNDTISHDSLQGRWHSEHCSYHGTVETCAANEICRSTFETIKGADNQQYRYVTKGCVQPGTCNALSSNNSITCTSYIEKPACTYCCQGAFCNFNPTTPIRTAGVRVVAPRLPCSPDPCYYGSQCVENSTATNGYICICKEGTWGDRCTYTGCSSAPCKNRAVCDTKYGSSTYAPYYYYCHCRAGYKGRNCTEDYGLCTQSICQNGGTCFEQDKGVRCRCRAGFVGESCQYKRPVQCTTGGISILSYETRTGGSTVEGGTRNCTSHTSYNMDYYRKSSYYISLCTMSYGNKHTKGVTGDDITEQDVHLHACDRGDSMMWYNYEICCAPCLSAPCMNGGWCQSANGTKLGLVCKCRHGYEGDYCERKVSVCYASGDPHYSTFDRNMLHFQGVCKFDMASSPAELAGENTEHVPFSIHTKNEQRNGNAYVSYTKYVELHVFGLVIRLGVGKIVEVDGVEVTPPLDLPGIEIGFNGRFVRLRTNFSLAVESDGYWTTLVKVPPQYAGKMQGICGNNDGSSANDLTTKEGVDVTDEPTKYSLIGNSWVVEDPEEPGCTPRVDPDPPECKPETKTMVKTEGYCGLIVKKEGIFSRCIGDSAVSEGEYFSNCEFDVCANQDDPNKAKAAACGSLEAFAAACASLGHVANWRAAASCPLNCSAGMEYQFSTSACPATCASPNAPSQCRLPDTESCVCPDGKIQDGNECIDPWECGCAVGEGMAASRVPIDTSWLSSDCSVNISCVECEKCPLPVGQLVKSQHSCNDGETCEVVDDETVCQETVVDPCTPDPCKNGKCVKDNDAAVCICEPNYTGKYCESHMAIDGKWSNWGPWSLCSDPCGEGSQTRTRTCSNPAPSHGGKPCSGTGRESRDCVCNDEFSTQEDCARCQMVTTEHGYMSDPCNCTLFHQCVKYGDVWASYLQSCPPCQHWNQDALTCVKVSDDCDTDEEEMLTTPPVVLNDETCTKDGLARKAVDGEPGSYIWVLDDGREYTMPCAPGTEFNFEACDCLRTEVPVATVPPKATEPMVCMDFDTHWGNWGFNSAKWIWITNSNVKQVSAGCLKGNCADFSGDAHLAINRFSNAYAALGEFAVSLWFKARSSLPVQGLVSNGDCLKSSSLEIYLRKSQASAAISTSVSSAAIDTQVRIGYWEHLVMSYDGTKLDLYLNGILAQSKAVTGTLVERHCPLLFGHKFDKNFFVGLMDEICVYDGAVSKWHAEQLYNAAKMSVRRK